MTELARNLLSPVRPRREQSIIVLAAASTTDCDPINYRLFRTLANHVCRIVAFVRGDSKITGTVTFEQESESAPTTITWNITGNDPNAERGMHVHAYGDNTNGCTSAGPHCASHIHLASIRRAGFAPGTISSLES